LTPSADRVDPIGNQQTKDNEMNTATRQYVVDLAVFLRSRGMTMSAVE
jgi:hypothetical protein